MCRRIREFSVFAELVPYDISYEEIQKHNPKGIIFSGGPSSVYTAEAPVPENKIFEMDLPLLGICYGHQLIVDKFGGKVKRANKEYCLLNDLKQKIYIAGHKGMVGSAIVRELERKGYTNLIYRTREELDLINQAAVKHFFETEFFFCRTWGCSLVFS